MCTSCSQQHIIRQLSNNNRDQTVCVICHQCCEDGYWPAGQCSGPCCARLRALAGVRTVGDILHHNASFQ
eukprot:6038714-Heterocapsa_arctica.AAC.1